MKLKAFTKEVQPGGKTKLGVHTTKNSFVSLLAVDKSVTLLGSDNDITLPRVSSDLQMYERSSYESDEELPEKYRDLAELNILILTNARGKPVTTCIVDRSSGNDDDVFAEDNEDQRTFGLNTEFSSRVADPVRNYFPETWLFNGFVYDTDAKFMSWRTLAPHTITSFVANAFAIHPEHGLAIAEEPVEFKVFKPFFIKLCIPYSMQLHEVLKVHVSVFNYLANGNEPISVAVDMPKDHGYEFQEINSKSCQFTASTSGARNQQQTLLVKPKNGKEVSFYIKATHIGRITIRVNAYSGQHSDSIVKQVKVMREGIRKVQTYSKAFDMRNQETDSFYVNLPPDSDSDFIANSVDVRTSITGDLLGPALSNIHNLM